MTDKCELQEIANRAADQAVKKTFLSLGIDVTDAQSVIKAQRSFQFLYSWTESSDTIKKAALKTAIGIFITGLLAAIWMQVKPH